MLKTRRKVQIEQVRFPEPREGLPEDPRPFIGSQHLSAAAAVQEQLSARCLVAVVGRLGAGKSTVCRRAANSRWVRQWYLQDEKGQPVHRRFWVDLEDCRPGAEAQERIAHVLGRRNFDEALDRLGNGRHCLLILDNADQAFAGSDEDGTWARLVACVDRGASIVVTRQTVSDLPVERPWSAIVEVTGFGNHDEAQQLFDHLAPQHVADLRSAEIVAACDLLPLAVRILGGTAAGADLEAARLRTEPGIEGREGLDFALEVSAAMLDREDRYVWGALSLFPSGLSAEDIDQVVSGVPEPQTRTVRLFTAGIAHRCESGVRIPGPLRLPPAALDLDDAAESEAWRAYVKRAQALIGPATADGAHSGGAGTVANSADQSGRGGQRDRPAAADRATSEADSWMTRQIATLSRLVSRPALPDGSFDLACTALLLHQSSVAPDYLDRLLVRLVDRGLGGTAAGAETAAAAPPLSPAPSLKAQAAQLAAALEDQRRFGAAVLVAASLGEAQRRAGDSGAEAAALCLQGRAERLWSHFDAAETHLAEAHHHYEQLGDGVGQGCALFELGQVALDRGQLDDAETYLDEALELFAANGRPIGEANTNLELVRADLARGRVDSAERRLAAALDRYESAGDRLGFANACLQLGQVELARGKLDRAERHFGGALDGYEQAADKVGFANACLQLGQVELARGRLPSAERRFGGALAGYQQVDDQVGVANASLQLGQIDLARGQLAQAGPRLLQALAAYERIGDRIGVANSYLQLGQVNLGLGELDEADRRFSAARSAYDDIGDVTGSANSRHLTATLRSLQGRPIEAMTLFGEAARLHLSIGRRASAAWSLAGAARTCTGRAERTGYATDAVRLLEEAGQAEAAAELALQLRAPAFEPVPDPDVKRHSWPPPPRQPPPGPAPAAEPWPRAVVEPEPVAAEPEPEPATEPVLAGEPKPATEPVLAAEPAAEAASEPAAEASLQASVDSAPATFREPDTAPQTVIADADTDADDNAGPRPGLEPDRGLMSPDWTSALQAIRVSLLTPETPEAEAVRGEPEEPGAPAPRALYDQTAPDPGPAAAPEPTPDPGSPEADEAVESSLTLFQGDDTYEESRRGRFRWRRRKEHPPDPPTLPGMEIR